MENCIKTKFWSKEIFFYISKNELIDIKYAVKFVKEGPCGLGLKFL